MILEDVEYLWQCMSEGFRLLNSEIGNDLYEIGEDGYVGDRFRLLNSEIGNDPLELKRKLLSAVFKFSSP